MVSYTALLISGVLTLIVMGLGLAAIDRMHRARTEARALRITLARALRGWVNDTGQGDGIDPLYAPHFFNGCEILGIDVQCYDVQGRPCLRGQWERYTLVPTLTDWLQENEG